jgi:hypothetical protein
MTWPVIVGSVVIGLAAVVVSILAGGGWALIVLEAAAAGLAVVLFLRAQGAGADDEAEPQTES